MTDEKQFYKIECPEPKPGMCACGKPLHYTKPYSKFMVQNLVDKLGEYVDVICLENGKTYHIPRHYIALHGLKGSDLPHLGFKEKISETSLKTEI